jgi:NAD+ synthase (glutamine-hydrolysing)
MDELRIAIGQVNCIVGNIKGNCARIVEYIERANSLGVDIVTFPELAITGYPPEDLLLKRSFIDENLKALGELAEAVGDIVVVVGFVNRQGGYLYNAAAVMYKRKIKGICHKTLLPNYGVFDEKRYFEQGNRPSVFRYGDVKFGVSICEDIWRREGPTEMMARAGAALICNINASPYHAGKIHVRAEISKKRIRENSVFISYTNMVGGQDELVFDGQSFVMDKKGRVMAQAEAFSEDLLVLDIPMKELGRKTKGSPQAHAGDHVCTITIRDKALSRERPYLSLQKRKPLGPVAEVYEALKLGLHDYVVKNGFQKTVIGLSGGIDSSIVAALAVDSLGRENVVGVFMPSRYTSKESGADTRELVKHLGIRLLTIPIHETYKAYLSTLQPVFSGLQEDITEENIQARIRGNILMALSNKFGWLVLTTGNKSEMSVGYATLYGDMAGGFAVIKDVPKTLVYRLSRYRNSLSPVIPARVLTKEPTAELKPDQKDRDTLPPYEHLDPVLKGYIEEDRDLNAIASHALSRAAVKKVLHMVESSEYKRRQSPPGIKITPKAFGKDRRMPITNQYRGR